MIDFTDGAILKALTAPETVALIGASNDEKRLTARPMLYMRRHGFRGAIHPVNPVRDEVLGAKAYASVTAIPGKVDMAYILLGTEPAIEALRDCAWAGVRVVAMLADGFAEAGDAGVERQAELKSIADEAGMLLIGPNSTGLVDTRSGLSCTTNSAFGTEATGTGRLAVLSQSGGMTGTVQSRGQARGMGFGTFVSTGNEAAATVADFGNILLADPDIDGFILFLETIRDRDALAAFARRAAGQGKPVVAYMTGRTDEGQALSVSHTGALTGSTAAVDAFLGHQGIRRVETFQSLLEAPSALLKAALPAQRPRTATVAATTGGGGAMVVDRLSAQGVAIAGCSPTSRKALEAKNIPLGHGKLVDVTMAGTTYDAMKAVVSTLIEDPETGVLVMAIGSSAQFHPELAVRPIVDAVRDASADAAPVVAFPIPHAPDSLKMLEAAGIPAFTTVESCAEVVGFLMSDAPLPEPVDEVLPQAAHSLLADTGAGVLDEVRSADIFEALGLARPAQLILAPDQVVPDRLPFDFPVAVKLVSAQLPHKTEAGAIRTGVETRDDLIRAITEMKAEASGHVPDLAIDGILIQEMCSGLGEALIGMTRDPLVGPVITVGMGGVMAELYRDTVVRPAPVSLEAAREMIAEVRGFALFRGYRGKPAGDLEALAEAIHKVSMLTAAPEVEEAEINPLAIGAEGQGVTMLDALIRLA